MICRECSAVVRFGWRHGRPGWWHREDLDHDAFPVVEPESTYEPLEIPDPEERSRAVDPKADEVPGGVRTVTNLIEKTDGWSLVSLTYARGPYLGAKGVLGISNHVMLKARLDGPGEPRAVVACWRDGKFDTAYALSIGNSPAHINATQVRGWIRGEDL